MLSREGYSSYNVIIRNVTEMTNKPGIESCFSESNLIFGAIQQYLILINEIYDVPGELISPKKDSTITLQIEKFLNWIINKNIRVPHSNDIRQYLLQHYDLLRFLPWVCKLAIEQFGPPHQISLEVYHDPEIPDESLNLYVRTPSYEENFIQTLDNIFPEYQAYLSNSTGWFSITTDFRPPM